MICCCVATSWCCPERARAAFVSVRHSVGSRAGWLAKRVTRVHGERKARAHGERVARAHGEREDTERERERGGGQGTRREDGQRTRRERGQGTRREGGWDCWDCRGAHDSWAPALRTSTRRKGRVPATRIRSRQPSSSPHPRAPSQSAALPRPFTRFRVYALKAHVFLFLLRARLLTPSSVFTRPRHSFSLIPVFALTALSRPPSHPLQRPSRSRSSLTCHPHILSHSRAHSLAPLPPSLARSRALARFLPLLAFSRSSRT